MPSASGTVRDLYFYPVKGLSPQPLAAVNLAPGEGFPFDRMFGLACFATEVSPQTGRRDITVPRLLKECYGHMDMGVYAEVLAGGVVKAGMPVVIGSGS